VREDIRATGRDRLLTWVSGKVNEKGSDNGERARKVSHPQHSVCAGINGPEGTISHPPKKRDIGGRKSGLKEKILRAGLFPEPEKDFSEGGRETGTIATLHLDYFLLSRGL